MATPSKAFALPLTSPGRHPTGGAQPAYGPVKSWYRPGPCPDALLAEVGFRMEPPTGSTGPGKAHHASTDLSPGGHTWEYDCCPHRGYRHQQHIVAATMPTWSEKGSGTTQEPRVESRDRPDGQCSKASVGPVLLPRGSRRGRRTYRGAPCPASMHHKTPWSSDAQISMPGIT